MSDDDVVDAGWAIQKGGGMSERESWMPSDEEINVACNEDDSPNYVPGEPSFVTTAPLVRAFVRAAVERALAKQEKVYKYAMIEAKIAALLPSAIALEDARAELAVLDKEGIHG